jgi:deazaflavin-dependent oxidoreductase (nitroreductase family)
VTVERLAARDADSWSASFLVPAGRARALVVAGLEPVPILPRRAVLSLAFARYRDSDLGQYEELAIAILVRRSGDPSATGLFLRYLPTGSERVYREGESVWGTTRLLAKLRVDTAPRHAVCRVFDGERHVLTIGVREGGPLRIHDPNLPNYVLDRDTLRATTWNQIGPTRARPGGARVELGRHPIADELRWLGLPKRALLSATMRGMRAEFASVAPAPLISCPERLRIRFEHLLDRHSVPLGVWLLRRTRGRAARLWHRRALVLNTRGRRTGRRRSVPLQFFEDGDAMVVVAANSGLPAPPGWYLNLIAEPRATVDVDGETVAVRAERLTDAEARAFWPTILERAPDYARFARRKGQALPLVRLAPRANRDDP